MGVKRVFSEEHKRKISEGLKAYSLKVHGYQKPKRKEMGTGRIFSDEHIRKLKEARAKRVTQPNPKKNTINGAPTSFYRSNFVIFLAITKLKKDKWDASSMKRLGIISWDPLILEPRRNLAPKAKKGALLYVALRHVLYFYNISISNEFMNASLSIISWDLTWPQVFNKTDLDPFIKDPEVREVEVTVRKITRRPYTVELNDYILISSSSFHGKKIEIGSVIRGKAIYYNKRYVLNEIYIS